MALYAIGDLHLSFGCEGKSMDIFGSDWKDHEEKVRRNWIRKIKDSDTVVLTGDHSWGKNEEQCAPDFDFIDALPGRKILLRGNHDMFWEVNKTGRLNEKYKGRFYFLQNNYYVYGGIALVGTKGYCYEGLDTPEHCEKILKRESERLRCSFEMAQKDGYNRYIVFLHYPPTTIGEDESTFTRMAKEYGAEQVIYSHSHGAARFHDSLQGDVNGIMYRLVSSDFLDFDPIRLL